MQRIAAGDAFDRGDLSSVRLHGEYRARFHRAAAQMNRTSAALTRVAPHVRAGETQTVAQKIDQQLARLDRCFVPDAVDRDGYRDALSVHSSSFLSHPNLRL